VTDASLLLDSHVWVWAVNDDAKLGRKAKAVIRERAERNAVAVSGVSFWELAVKAGKGRVEFSPDVRGWLAAASRLPGIGVIDIDRDLMLRATSLDWSHADPADRMLVATAISYELDLVSADRAILEYARTNKGLSTVDATR
jgi:PIN domain nuclease of toxin-antitoxin system